MRAALVLVVGALAGLGCQPRNEYTPPPPPEVDVAQPIERPVTDYLEFTGTTRAVALVDLRARVSGYLERIHFEDGAAVEKDQLLFTIDQAPYQAQVRIAQAELRKARAELQLAEQELGRLTSLRRRNALSQQELDIQQAKYNSAQAVVIGAEAVLAEAELQLSYTEIRAPISGRIGRHLVDPGNLVQIEQTLLATIEAYDPIHVYFTLSESDLLELRRQALRDGRFPTGSDARPIAEAVNQVLEMQLGGEEGYPYQGRLDFTELGVDPGTGTLEMRGLFQNPDRVLLPGLFVKVRTAVGAAEPRLLVPERALGSDQQGDYVLVVNEEGKVEYRTVALGQVVEGMRVVAKGLEGDEWIVVNGVQRARPGAPVNPVRGQIGVEGEALATWIPIEPAEAGTPPTRTARPRDAEPVSPPKTTATAAAATSDRPTRHL